MEWMELKIKTTHTGMDFINDLLESIGVSGIVIEDPQILNEYIASGAWDYTDLKPIKDSSHIILKAYLPLDENFAMKKKDFLRGMNDLAKEKLIDENYEISTHSMHDEDWANNWKKYFHPTRIGKHIVICPSWEDCTKKENDIVIRLDPEMAFGTGTHPSTSMCIAELEGLVKKGMHILDIGTGSGILAITSALLGAQKVEAVDIDSISLKVAKKNIKANELLDRIHLHTSDLLANVHSVQADIITANLVADLIIRLLPSLGAYLKEDGIFLASGIIDERLDDVVKAVKKHDFSVEKILKEKNWRALRIKRAIIL